MRVKFEIPIDGVVVGKACAACVGGGVQEATGGVHPKLRSLSNQTETGRDHL